MRKLILLLLVLSACTPARRAPSTPLPTSQQEASPTPAASGLWIGSAVPQPLRDLALRWGLPLTSQASSASVVLDVERDLPPDRPAATWIYVLVAPFPTVLDGVTFEVLRALWNGDSPPLSDATLEGQPLWMSASTLAALSAGWGAPAPGSVRVASADQLLDLAWRERPSWAIVPFEALEPRWKVLSVDGQSPIRKDFEAARYPLQVTFSLRGATFQLPSTNRDPSRMTTLILSGTTALVRWIAYKMEIHGVNYPAGEIGDWLRQADITHVSNEVSFDPRCPPPNPYQSRFYCSDPKYLGLLREAGVDVVELTGNHNLDNGAASALYSLELYRQNGMRVFGGGANLEEARRPLRIEHHGNRIAFVGCNEAGPRQAWATANSPGANPCDYKQLFAQIAQLRQEGYLVIATFQYREAYSPQAVPWQVHDFRQTAAAGALIVSGSQSHFPLNMEFYHGAFIHYGLGNLFFDQMGNLPPAPNLPPMPAARRAFIDRHVFYDGRYISTELLTTMLEDYSRPRPMTGDERAAFLREYFAYSGWFPWIPTPTPRQTPTLIPLPPFVPLPTHTPLR